MSEPVAFDPGGELVAKLAAAARAGKQHDCAGSNVPADWLRSLIVGENVVIHEKGVRLSNAKIKGKLDLEAVNLSHGVHLEQCTFDEPIVCKGARFRELFLSGSVFPRLQAAALELKGHLWLNGAVLSNGIDINSATIGGQFSANEAELNGGGGLALLAQGAEITGGVFLTKATVSGQIDINSATIGGPFAADEAELDGGDGIALRAQAAEITGGVFLRKATVSGQININSATIGHFSANEAELDGGDGAALFAQDAEITGNVFLNKATVSGQININSATIGSQFSANEAELDGGDGLALLAQAAEVTGGIFLTKATVSGQININGATTSFLTIEDASVASSGSVVVSAHASVGRLVWTPKSVQGVVDVRDCRVETWVLRASAAGAGADRWHIGGFTYQRIETLDQDWDVKSRIQWLNASQDEGSPGPYQEMAALLRREGHINSSCQVLIAGNERLLQGPRGLLRRVLFGWTIGYGYRPWRVLLYLTPLFVGLALAVSVAPADPTDPSRAWMVTDSDNGDVTAANDCAGQGPCLQPVVYALDTILPVIDFGQADDWTVNRLPDRAWTLATLVWISIAAGWLFGILLAAAAGGLVRQT